MQYAWIFQQKKMLLKILTVRAALVKIISILDEEKREHSI